MQLNLGADDANDLIFDDLDDEFKSEESEEEEKEVPLAQTQNATPAAL